MSVAPTRPLTTEASSEKPGKVRKGPIHELFELGKTIFYALLIALVLRVLLFQPFTIPSASMEQTLLIGDYIIVSKYSYGWSRHSIPFSPPLFKGRILEHTPKRGDIVVFKTPQDNRTDYIKRLIGLPGDRIQVSHGAVSINGVPVPRVELKPDVEDNAFGALYKTQRFQETFNDTHKTFVTRSIVPDGDADNTDTYVVPAGNYFMMGDNRDNSLDSRFPTDVGGVGFVPAENLVGRAEVVMFSWKKGASLLKPWTWVTDARADRFGMRLR